MKRLSILFKKNLNRQYLMKAKLFPFSMASFVHSFVSFANSQKKKKNHLAKKIPSRNLPTHIPRNRLPNRGNFTKYYISTIHEDLVVKSSLSFTTWRGGCTRDKRMQRRMRSRIGGLLHDCSSETILSMRVMRGMRLLYSKYSMWNSQIRFEAK